MAVLSLSDGNRAELGDVEDAAEGVGEDPVEQGSGLGGEVADHVGGQGEGSVERLTGCVGQAGEGGDGDGDPDDRADAGGMAVDVCRASGR